MGRLDLPDPPRDEDLYDRIVREPLPEKLLKNLKDFDVHSPFAKRMMTKELRRALR